MKKIVGFLFALTLFTSCTSRTDQVKATAPAAKAGEQVATFAGGCFWGIQEGFLELKGVIKATSGYTGGTTENPTYEEVTADKTGHAEAVQVIYDPNVISFAQLLAAFFILHDPTQLNRQGPDVGQSYRSIAFYNNSAEQRQIEDAISKYQKAKLYTVAVVTEVKPYNTFYPAENYHQNYYQENPYSGYIRNVCGPKVEKLRQTFPDLIKPEYQ